MRFQLSVLSRGFRQDGSRWLRIDDSSSDDGVRSVESLLSHYDEFSQLRPGDKINVTIEPVEPAIPRGLPWLTRWLRVVDDHPVWHAVRAQYESGANMEIHAACGYLFVAPLNLPVCYDSQVPEDESACAVCLAEYERQTGRKPWESAPGVRE